MNNLRVSMLSLGLIAGVAVAEDSCDHEPRKSLSLKRDDVTIWAYQFAEDVGFPYFHPVATAGGEVLTNFAPADHRWHRGIWFSWKFLNGVNYWDWGGRKMPVPEGRTQTVGEEVVAKEESGVSIATELRYTHQDKLVLQEKREITIESPRADGSYAIDWCMTFTAPEKEVVFERTPPKVKPWGGYGGLSCRASAKLKNHRVINSAGQEGKEGHGKPARWMDFSGALPNGKLAGVAMFDHPDNPRHPTPWYVATGRMGYFNPAFLFHEPFTLPAGESLTLRYGMLIHARQLESPALEKEYEAFKCRTCPRTVPPPP